MRKSAFLLVVISGIMLSMGILWLNYYCETSSKEIQLLDSFNSSDYRVNFSSIHGFREVSKQNYQFSIKDNELESLYAEEFISGQSGYYYDCFKTVVGNFTNCSCSRDTPEDIEENCLSLFHEDLLKFSSYKAKLISLIMDAPNKTRLTGKLNRTQKTEDKYYSYFSSDESENKDNCTTLFKKVASKITIFSEFCFEEKRFRHFNYGDFGPVDFRGDDFEYYEVNFG